MRRRLVLFVCVAGCLVAGAAVPRQAKSVSAIHTLYIEDQQDRSDGGPALQGEQMLQRDAARREQAHKMLEAGTLKSADDFHDAAFIYQHGQTSDDYLLAHALGTVAVAK